jgi:hypothetical protein
MSSQKCFLKLAALLLGCLALASSASAQDPQNPQEPQEQPDTPTKPKPAARGIPLISDPNSTVENQTTNSTWQPDNGPATGMQTPSLGSPELAHSYWVPGLEYGSTIQSRPLGQQAPDGWYANNYVGGDFSLLEAWSRSQFGLNYSGGGFFTTDSLQSNGWYSQLSAGENITLSRLQIQLFDYFSYIPDSQFGFAGGTALALPGINGTLGPAIPGLGVAIVPNQSIYSAVGPRYSNAFAAQTTYSLSRRSSLTFGGSYGLLNFTQSGNVNYDMVIGTAGYNHALNKTDSLGLLYRFTAYHYTGEPQALGNHVINVVYVKRVTQRLALSLFGGPQVTTYRVPIGTQTHSISGSGGATLNYAVERGNIGVTYFHGLTGGGGVLLGSNTDLANLTLGRQLGRVWAGNVNFGYSRNGSLGNLSGPSPTYNDWFVGGGVSRPIGREFNFAFSYSARFESSNATGCTGTICDTSYTQHLISVSLQWHTRPFVLP